MKSPELHRHAQHLRREPTPAEQALWERLSRPLPGGHKFQRRAVVGGVTLGFHCVAGRLAVEVDGSAAAPAEDSERDALLARFGIRTMRVSEAEIGADVDAVVDAIVAALAEREGR